MPLTWPCFYNGGHLLGIVGLDVHLSDLVEKLTYFNNQSHAYTFLLSTKGMIVWFESRWRCMLFIICNKLWYFFQTFGTVSLDFKFKSHLLI